MDIRTYFKEYIDTVNRIKETCSELDRIKPNLYGVKAIKYDDMPSGGGVSDPSYLVIKKMSLESNLKILVARCDELRDKKLQKISLLDNDTSRRIIRLYWLEQWTVDEVANELQYTKSHTFKLKRQAEHEFSKLIQNDTH